MYTYIHIITSINVHMDYVRSLSKGDYAVYEEFLDPSSFIGFLQGIGKVYWPVLVLGCSTSSSYRDDHVGVCTFCVSVTGDAGIIRGLSWSL